MKPSALHERIRNDIEQRIMSGVWGAGHRIPREIELMAEYGCSRMTVNKALAGLAERGMIDRRKRAGTFVAAPRVHRAAIEIPDIAAEIEARGMRYRLELIARSERQADAGDRDLLGISAGPILALTCLHHANDRPFALEERQVNLSAVPAAMTVDFSQESPGRWLLGHVPWTDARHRIAAIAADGLIARRLGVVEGSPCLSIERWTWRSDERITYVHQIYPGGDYSLIAGFLA